MKRSYQKPVIALKEMGGMEDSLKSQKMKANPEITCRKIAGEVILVPSGSMAGQFNGLASLNSTGAFLWSLLEQGRTLEELIVRFAEEYELTIEQSTEDVTAFLKLAQTKNLIVQS